MTNALFLGVSFGLTYLLMPYLIPMVGSNLVRKNFLDEPIPTALGVVFIFVPVPLILLLAMISPGDRFAGFIVVVTILVFGVTGYLDDTLGNRDSRGFLGHFRTLAKGTLTTGAVKALFGGLMALIIAIPVSDSWITLLINGMIIALFANLFNLFDVRPGRSGKLFLLLVVIFWLFSGLPTYLWIVLGVTLAYLPWDLNARVMLGDVGANILGALIGLQCHALPIMGRVVILVLLVGLHLVSERISFTKIIANNPVLRFLDEFGRKR